MTEYAALIATDWADKQHTISLFDPSTGQREQMIVKHTPIERSGKQTWIRWRYFAPKFFRQTFHEFAAESIQHSFWARAYYAMQRAKGKEHHAAVRALAFKWIRIIWKCWQTRTPYNEIVYLESLRRSGSPLLKFAAEHQA